MKGNLVLGLGRKAKIKKIAKQFFEQSEWLYIFLVEELNEKYPKIYGHQLTSSQIITLSAQVANYLIGRDIDQNAATFDEDIQKNIGSIRKNIKPAADDLLTNNKELCELIVCLLRIKNTINYELYGRAYLLNPDFKAAGEVINNYGRDFPKNPDQILFFYLVKKFFDTRPDKFDLVKQIRAESLRTGVGR